VCVYICKKSTKNPPQNKPTNQPTSKSTKKIKKKSHNNTAAAFLIHLHPSVCRDKWDRAAGPVLFWFSPSWITGMVGWKVVSTEQMHLSEGAGKGKESVRQMFLSKYFLICCQRCSARIAFLMTVRDGKKPRILLL